MKNKPKILAIGLVCWLIILSGMAQAQTTLFSYNTSASPVSTDLSASAATLGISPGSTFSPVTWTMPTNSGTFGTTASSPIRVSQTTGGTDMAYLNATTLTNDYDVYVGICYQYTSPFGTIGMISHSQSSSSKSGVMFDLSSGNGAGAVINLRTYAYTAGAISVAVATTAITVTAGQFVYLKEHFSGTTATFSYTTPGATLQAASSLSGLSYPNAAGSFTVPAGLTAAGQFGIIGYTSSASQVVCMSVVQASSSSAAASPATLAPSTAGQTVTITGTGTAWVNGTTTFALSGVGATGSSITATSITGQVATLTVTTGATLGTLTFTDSSAAATVSNVTITAPSVAIAVTDANVYWSPFNWVSVSPTGAMQTNNVKVGAASVRTNNPGSYHKFAFNEPASGFISVQFNSASLTTGSVPAAAWPILKYSVDNGPWQFHQEAAADSGTFTYASSLAAGTHTILCYTMATSASYDRWTTPVESLQITGFTLASGSSGTVSSVGTDVAVLPNTMIFYGDSETEGQQILSGTYPALYTTLGTTGYDSTLTMAISCAKALSCEVGVRGYGAAGYNGGGNGGVPTIQGATGYALNYDGTTAMDSSIVPKYVFDANGTNGVPASASVLAFLNNIRSIWTVGGGTYIFEITIPTLTNLQYNSIVSAKAAAVLGYDSKTFALPVPWTSGLEAYQSLTFPDRISFDRLHMNSIYSTQVGGYIGGQVLKLIAGTNRPRRPGTGGGFGN